MSEHEHEIFNPEIKRTETIPYCVYYKRAFEFTLTATGLTLMPPAEGRKIPDDFPLPDLNDADMQELPRVLLLAHSRLHNQRPEEEIDVFSIDVWPLPQLRVHLENI